MPKTIILDRNSALPLYYQIQQALLRQIRDGSLKAGQPMPSEQEIARRLCVSRMTARQGLKSLCDLGVAFSRRGKGTFVCRAKLEKNFRHLRSFSEEMSARGSQTSAQVIHFTIVPANAELSEALQLAANEEVISLARVRYVDSQPMAVEESHLPANLCPDLFERFDLRSSLYHALFENYGIQVLFADEIAEARLATEREKRLLRIAVGSPVFYFKRLAYSQSGKPVEYVKAVYRGDRYKVVSRLTRGEGGMLTRKG